MAALGIVYVLTNEAMPTLVKIGMTSADDAAFRLSQLYSTGVPLPFKLEFACRVPNPEAVEKALHIAFGPHRINPKREFFKMEAMQAIAVLRLLHVEDATIALAASVTGASPEEVAAAETFASKRPPLNFETMGIPIGAILEFAVDGPSSGATVVVASARRVRFGDEDTYLTTASQRLLGVTYAVRPGPMWRYQGRLLSEIYEETYGAGG